VVALISRLGVKGFTQDGGDWRLTGTVNDEGVPMQATNVEVAEYLGEMLMELSKVAAAGGLPLLAAKLRGAAMEAQSIAGTTEQPWSPGDDRGMPLH